MEQDEAERAAGQRPISFVNLFGGPRPAPTGAADGAYDAGPDLLELRLVRLASGWGGLVGLALGIVLGAAGGLSGVVLGAAAGLLAGSMLGVLALSLLAGAVARLGVAWGLGLAVALTCLLVSQVAR